MSLRSTISGEEDSIGLGLRGANGVSSGLGLVIGLTRGGGGGVQTPFGFQGFLHFLGRREFQVTDLAGNNGTFVGGLEFGHQFGLELAGFLGVQVAHFLGHVDQRGNGFVVAFFGEFFGQTTGTADLHG